MINEENYKTEKYKRKSIFADLKKFEFCSKEGSFIEITEWKNGEGWDVNISNYTEKLFNLSIGELQAIKKLIKELDKK